MDIRRDDDVDRRDRSLRRSYVGSQLQALRRQRGWSLTQLAERSGVSISHLGRIERGVTSPSYAVIAILTETLEADLTQFVLESRGQARLARFLESTLREAGMSLADINRILAISPEGQERLVSGILSQVRSS